MKAMSNRKLKWSAVFRTRPQTELHPSPKGSTVQGGIQATCCVMRFLVSAILPFGSSSLERECVEAALPLQHTLRSFPLSWEGGAWGWVLFSFH